MLLRIKTSKNNLIDLVISVVCYYYTINSE